MDIGAIGATDIRAFIPRDAEPMQAVEDALREIVAVKLGDLDDVRRLVVIDKLAPTPDVYPRAGGAPKNKPL